MITSWYIRFTINGSCAQLRGVVFVFYDVFLNLCKNKNISVSKAATEMGLNRSTVTFWKNETYSPRQGTLKKIADYFGVTIDYLLTGEQREKAPDICFSANAY
ncbi:MAG: helix-turn-helix transcriptional regulator [Oscillospiraceae bacterium]